MTIKKMIKSENRKKTKQISFIYIKQQIKEKRILSIFLTSKYKLESEGCKYPKFQDIAKY